MSIDDEYFGTLGGSLMKDLLADLQVDDGDFSLDQLEKELATLEQDPTPLPSQQPLPALDAAALVVSHAQERATDMPPIATTNQGADAWSLSLQNFQAMSLHEDFLAADSARKKQQATAQPSQPSVLEGAEDYDISEKATLTAPPGLGGPPPAKETFPKTPQNSINLPAPPAPAATAPVEAPPVAPPTSKQPTQPPAPMPPQQVPMPAAPPAQGGMIPGMAPPGAVPMMTPQKMMSPQGMPQPVPPHMISPQGPLPGQPVMASTPGPAWQTPRGPPQPPPQTLRVFCNPHPAAPPIPGSALETRYMNARDITYVVHSILRPVLTEGINEDDYFIQFLRRLGGQANPSNPKQSKDINEEMASRAMKTKEWSSEKGVLGRVTKSNVARPRALIATPVAAEQQDSEQKQRATLWKARIYCDQAYYAYQTIVDIWKAAPPGSVPPQVQAHTAKLMKCMGITTVDKEYQIDRSSLTLLLKLSKGRTLMARALEQAILPPKAVLVLLPVLIDILLGLLSKRSPDEKVDDMSIERLFRATTNVIQRLDTSSDTLLQCLDVYLKNGKVSLGSAARMECAHALLRKGAVVVGQDPAEDKRAAWGKAEGDFMTLLQAF